MSEAYKKLIKTLRTLFEMDKADLDFGIYRILNQKRDEISRFLDEDLLPQVKAAFADYAGGGKAELQAELEQAIEQAKQFGAPDPEQAPPVLAIKAKLASAVDITAVENEVYSHLHTFFSRYYDQGDFISQRRYKADTYAIPYEGEEVKLYWANHDQYYVKSSEHLRDYAFTVHDDDGRTVRIKLVEADTEKDNVKAAADQERRFVLDAEQPIHLEGDELQIRFQYVPAGRKKQDALNAEAVATIFAQPGYDDWLNLLRKPAPTEANPKRTLLEKHLNDYTRRNTFDYFINKDLGGFLRRELDFYIKSEVLHLDDIDDSAFVITEAHLRKIKVLRAIAHKIIKMLAQIEDFQKRLWTKQKFVVDINFCTTMDRVPSNLFKEIIENHGQVRSWTGLSHDRDNNASFPTTESSLEHLVAFFNKNPRLALDTQWFSSGFKERLIAQSGNLFDSQPRWLIKGENFQALTLLLNRFKNQIRCIYIDPPYNTGNDEFLYKDHFQHSSWCASLFDRLKLAHALLANNGSFMISIGEEELGNLQILLDNVFGRENRISLITVKRASVTGHKVINPGVVNVSEYVLIYAKNRTSWIGNSVYAERERDSRYSTFIKNRGSSHQHWLFVSVLDAFAEKTKIEKSKLRKHYGERYEAELTNFVYDHADSVCQLVTVNLGGVGAEFRDWVKKSSDSGGKVLLYQRDGLPDAYLYQGRKIIFYSDKLMRIGSRLATAERASDIWTDVLPNDIHNEGGVDLKKGKKPEALLLRLIELATEEDDIVLDFFAGTGTAAAAAQKMNRRWIAVESADFFDDKPLQRLKNVLTGESRGISERVSWKGGGSFAVYRLEGYEDTLNNLLFRSRSKRQQDMLDDNLDLREDYMLGYWLDVETADSPSLLNVDQFEDPFNYKLNIATVSVGAFKPTIVDLVETFNFLIGLRVKHIDNIRGFKVVTGTNPQDESVLVIWRKVEEQDNTALEAFLEKQGYNPRDTEFDRIYVNGDHTLEDPHSKVKMTEIEFKRLMFDIQDV